MSLHDFVSDHLPHTVQIKRRTGYTEDGYHEPLYSEPETVRARVERRTRLIRNQRGEQAVANTQVVMQAPVSVGDLLAVGVEFEAVEAVDEDLDLDGNVVDRVAYLER